MQDWQEKINTLEKEGLSVRVEKDGKTIFQSKEPMLKPLLVCLQQHRPELAGATVIDKIVGRAAAYLCVVGQVSTVITPLASESAQTVLTGAGITLQASHITPQIKNRERTGPCPMEEMASGYSNAEDFYAALLQRVRPA
jgi:hypothetical protein